MPEPVRWGPQPYEGFLSAVCESFGCTPEDAERQDSVLVRAILDYRNARWAVDAFNDRQHGAATMQRNPHLGNLLVEMLKAQSGAGDAEAAAMLDARQTMNAGDDE